MVYICKSEPENPIITTATVGSKNPIYCTSLGKTLLAFLPKEQSDALLSDMEIQPRTQYTLKDAEELARDLDLIRARVMRWISVNMKNIWSAPALRSISAAELWKAPSASPASTVRKTIMKKPGS